MSNLFLTEFTFICARTSLLKLPFLIKFRFVFSSGFLALNSSHVRGGSRAATTSKGERLEAFNWYHNELHLGCCSSPRSASACDYVTYFTVFKAMLETMSID